MLKMTFQKLEKIKDQFRGKNIVVIGDMMLDCYFWGDVKRISPEAPVPVVEVDNEFYRFGGAANVANNILTLGGNPVPVGVIGDDEDGKRFMELMTAAGISSEGIFIDKSRPTTAKTRVIADNHHIVRIDKEKKNNISGDLENEIIDFIGRNIGDINAFILQDYNKGVLTKKLIREVIHLCNQNGKIVTVDPKFNNFFEFEGVTVFKPNRKETEDVFGIRIKTSEDITDAGKRLLKDLNAEFVLLTLGEEGIALFERDRPERRIPTKARKVADVSGAGDTVISTLTLALAAGADIFEAAYLANYAAGIVCEEVGIAPIELERLFETVYRDMQ